MPNVLSCNKFKILYISKVYFTIMPSQTKVHVSENHIEIVMIDKNQDYQLESWIKKIIVIFHYVFSQDVQQTCQVAWLWNSQRLLFLKASSSSQ